MKELHEIEYDGKVYTVHEPTLDVWSQLTRLKGLESDMETAITIIGWVTGLTDEQIAKANAASILTAAEGIIDYYVTQSSKFYESFEFNGKTYKFIDLANMTFGEFIDIDDFLNKPDTERKMKLNELMALLYREVNEKGKYLPYDIDRIKDTAQEFKKLPLKYFNGSMAFFFAIETILRANTPYYFLSKYWMIQKMANLKRKIKTLLVGFRPLFSWLTKTYLKLTKWLKETTSRFSIS